MSRARLPGGRVAGGCPRRASGPSVPLSADTASPPPRLCGPGGRRPREGRRGRELRLRPLACRGLRGRSLPFESFLAPQAAFGCHCPWGVGGWGWSRATRRGPAVVAGGVGSRPPVRRRSPSRPRRRCFPAPGRRGPPPYAALPLRCLSRRASAARAPLPGAPPPPRGSRPVGTGGSRPGPSPRARPRPGDACPGGDPRDAAASARRCALSPRAAAVPRFAPRRSRREGVVGGGGGGAEGMSGGGARCVRRPFGLRRPCVPRPFSPPHPAPRPPRRRPPPRPSRGRRLVLPAPPRLGVSLSVRRPRPLPPPPPPPPPPPGGATGRRWSVGCCVGAWARGGPGGGRSAAGLSVPLLGTLLAGALAARARARALRDATSDQTWRPAEFKHISQRRKRN